MKKTAHLRSCLIICLSSFFLLAASAAFCQSSALLKEGIDQYKLENYEEALVVLQKAREEDPKSSIAAFYLGLAYKQTNDIKNALANFRDAVTLIPPVREAIVELIDSLRQTGQFEEAKKWISLAEREDIEPAKVAFLKGMILQSEAKYAEAAMAFQKAKDLDPAYGQSANFQIGICHMGQRDYGKAEELFKAAVIQDPLSDLATYARRYQEVAEQRRYLERPLRLTLTLLGQYDTNMLTLASPYSGAPPAFNEYATATDKESLAMLNTVRLDYVPILRGPFIFNASYTGVSNIHHKYTSHDALANSLTLAPGITVGDFAVNLVGNYTHALKRDPSYQRYSDNMSIGPLFRYLIAPRHILQLYGAYVKSNFFKPAINPELEDMSGSGFDSYINWIWLIRQEGLFSLRYGYSVGNTDGIDYENQGHRFSANLIYPVWRTLKVQITGDVFMQDYRHENIFYANAKRKDRVYAGTVGLIWDIRRYVSLMGQYMRTWANSNIYAYDYTRDVYSVGVEFRF